MSGFFTPTNQIINYRLVAVSPSLLWHNKIEKQIACGLRLCDLDPLFLSSLPPVDKMADSQEERKKRDDQIRDTIMAKLVETGEKDRLKDMLRDRLIQCGWRDELKEYCKDIIRRKGLEKVTVEELVAEITPQGRGEKIFAVVCLMTLCFFDIINFSDCTGRSEGGIIEENKNILEGDLDKGGESNARILYRHW
jgi:enhancer of yellow 2 transcription factor